MISDPALSRMTELVRSLTEILRPGLPAVDFQDERCLLLEGGAGGIGIGEASGPDRADRAAMHAMADLAKNTP